MFGVSVDALGEFLDVAEGTAADGTLGNETEPAFDLIEPRRVSWGVVDVVARPGGEPDANFGVLVGGVVIDDEMQVERDRNAFIKMPQEGQELLMAVPGLALDDDLAALHVEGGKQRRRAVAHVVMGDAFDVTQTYRQDRLGKAPRYRAPCRRRTDRSRA